MCLLVLFDVWRRRVGKHQLTNTNILDSFDASNSSGEGLLGSART